MYREHDPNRTHETYTHTPRHWCPQSEKYTGAHSLLTALRRGWVIQGDFVFHEMVSRESQRPVSVFYFRLAKGSQRVTMPIIESPYVNRILTEHGLRTVAYRVVDTMAQLEKETAQAL